MMINKFIRGMVFPVALAGLTVSGNLYGQATASPYSFFGIGEVDPGNYGENSGMAGIGIGFCQPNSLNTSNPAAISAIMPQTFIFDGACFGKVAAYTGQGKREYAGSGNVRRVAIGFRVTNSWAMSVGMAPLSSIGYDIRKSTPVEGGEGTLETSFSGSGGLSKVYVSQAFSLTPKLSVGVNASVVFGTVTHTEDSPYWHAEQKSRGDRICFDFGVQYTEPLNKSRYLTVGLVGGFREKMSMYTTRYAYDYEGSPATNEVLPRSEQYIPEFYGLGVSLAGRKTTFGIDYLFQKWSRVASSSGTVRYKDMHKVSLGMSYVPNRYSVRSYWERVKYQAGVSVNDSYLSVSSRSETNYAVTAGLVFPMRNSNTIHFSTEYGKNGFPSGTRNAIRENYFKFTLGFSFKETWFIKVKYD